MNKNPQLKTDKVNFKIVYFMLICLVSGMGCGKTNSDTDTTSYIESIRQWQANRTEQIGREDGWLSLAGLYWLIEGKNTIGTDPSNSIILPEGSTLPQAGAIILKKDQLSLVAGHGAKFLHKDSLITGMKLISDESGKADPTVLSAGSVSFYIIKRGDRYGVRVKDKNNQALVNYRGLDFYPPDPAWRIEGVYKPHPEPKLIEIASIIGTAETDTFPGMIVLRLDGHTCSLDVTSNPRTKELYLMFTDQTTGRETYGNGRQLSIPPPDGKGNVTVDFNKAANWPCAYTAYGTCPIPPKQNHIPVSIEAGEKKYPGDGRKTNIE